MDPLTLSRIRFAVATYFHFLFVPLTLGLAPMIAILETIYVRTGDEDYKKAAQFWGKLFLINFAVGIVTGITLEFQFGTNWSRYSEYVGDIFRGVPVDVDGIFHGNLLTLLNPYGLLGGVLFVLLFAVHGSNWLAIKAEGELAERAARMAKTLWIPTVLVAVAFLVTSWFATPLWENYLRHVWMWVFPLLAVAGLLFTRWRMQGGRWWLAWGGSAAAIGGATLWGVAGLYPNLYPSSLDPAASLSIHNSASSPLTLTIMLVVAGICVPGVIAYQSWVYYTFRGKVTDEVLSEPEAY